ncbi:MAG: hypothetical protein J07HQX50_01713 [Haloquadratum sp. J07HQX50]|nr:MAG: hypothetical protein J07HQX50_01713 [Haloquadratum sp. J07HQX50]
MYFPLSQTLFIGLTLIVASIISGAIVLLSSSFTVGSILIIATIAVLEILGGV